MSTIFIAKAPGIVGDLMRDLTLTVNQSCGILGNIGHECGGFALMQEIHPVSGIGGYGWCQWTGPRRRTFFAFCAAHNLSVDSDAGNYAYLLEELRTTEKAAIVALKRAATLEDCTLAFEQGFERAGVPAISSRVKWSKLALSAYAAAHSGKPAPEVVPVQAKPRTSLSVASTPAAAIPVAATPRLSVWPWTAALQLLRRIF